MKFLIVIITLFLTAKIGFAQKPSKLIYFCSFGNESKNVNFDILDKHLDEGSPSLSLYLEKIKHIRQVPINKIIIKKAIGEKNAYAYYHNIGDKIYSKIAVDEDYYKSFFTIEKSKNAAIIFVLGHELSHFLNGGITGNEEDNNRYDYYLEELTADKDAGVAISKLTNMDVSFLNHSLITMLQDKNTHNEKHPATRFRVLAAKAGFWEGKLSNNAFDKDININENICVKSREDGKITLSIHEKKSNEHYMFVTFQDNNSFTFGKSDGNGNFSGDVIHYKSSEEKLYIGICKENEIYDNTGLMLWKSGTEYFGGFKSGNYDGKGRLSYKNGDEYDGEWRNNVKHGSGSFYRKKGDTTLTGCWQNGKYIGKECN